jgi:outer membrane receptor for ferrienterochelin and colicins
MRSRLATLAVLGCRLATAQELCVSVKDPAGLPAPEASVTLEPRAAAAIVRGVTGPDGRFCAPVSPGEFVVRVSHEGLMGAASAVTVPSGAARFEREFTLSLVSVASHVEVTASRLPETLLDAPAAVRQIDRAQVERLGARQLNDALQEQPEVVTFAGGAHAHGGSTNLQGFSSRNVEILIDGQPLSGRVSGYIDLNQIDSSIVEAVEIKTGASAMTYGLQGQGGAINLITRRAGSSPNGSVESGFGGFNTTLLRAEGGFSAAGWSAFAAATRQRSLGYDLDPSTAVATQSPNRVRNLFASIYAPQWKNVNSGVTALWLDQTYRGFDVSTTNSVYDFNRPKKRVALLPRATMALGGRNLVSVRARHLFYLAEEDLVYRAPFSMTVNATTQEANGAEVEWSHAAAGGIRSLAGLFFNRQDIKGSRLGTSDGNAARNSWSQVASVDYALGGRLKAQAGYRFDRDSAFGAKLSPQASVAARAGRGVSLSASATRGFRAPDFSELYLNNTHAGGRVRVLGNTGLQPEQSWSYTAGALYAPGDRFRIETRLFENRLHDMILSRLAAREGTASIYRYQNVGGATIRGGLVSVEAAFNRSFEAHASYQYLVTRDAVTGLPLEYAPRHRAAVGATWSSRSHGLLASAFANLTGRTYFGLVNNSPDFMRSFELFGVNAQKDVGRNLALRVTFRNLTDDVDPLYRVTAPFSIEASIRIRLGAGR